MASLLNDIRYGIRTLTKSPGFTLVAILMLALGIGADTAIFSAVDTALLRSAPYKNAARLVTVWEKRAKEGALHVPVAPADFFDWRAQSKTLEHMAAYDEGLFALTGTGSPVRLRGARFSPGFLEALGVQPLLGRTFERREEEAGSHRSVLLSHGLWQTRYNGDPHVVGRTVEIDSEPFVVIGVLPSDFRYPFFTDCQLFVPYSFTPEQRANRSLHQFGVIADLKPGVTLHQAEADMDLVALQLERQYPDNAGHGVSLQALNEHLTSDIRSPLILLIVAVGLVLLIACSNVANLVLARSVSRRKEIGIRLALGATRGRVVQQLLVEGALLSSAATLLGFLFAMWSVDATRLSFFTALEPFAIAGLDRIHLDLRVLAFAMGLALITPCLFAAAPALVAARGDFSSGLREAGRGASFGNRKRFRSALIITEVALSMVMLIGSGLLLKSYWKLMQVDTGFQPEHLYITDLALPAAKYKTDGQSNGFYAELLRRLQATPSIRSAAISQVVPFTPGDWRLGITIANRVPRPGERFRIYPRYVSPAYLSTMGIAMKSGRGISEADTKDRPPVAVLSETAARMYWPNQNPIGQRFCLNGEPQKWVEVAGIAADVKDARLDRDATPDVYLAYVQITVPVVLRSQHLVVRTAESLTTVVPMLRGVVASLDRDQPVSKVASMDGLIAASVAPRRFNMILLGGLTILALVLSAAGLYSVMAYVVTERSGEIGIRMALGAKRGHVLRLMLGQGLTLAGMGMVVGAGLAFIATRLLQTMLFGVTRYDATVFSSAAGLLLAVTLLANCIPALRATKVDPIQVLRRE